MKNAWAVILAVAILAGVWMYTTSQERIASNGRSTQSAAQAADRAERSRNTYYEMLGKLKP